MNETSDNEIIYIYCLYCNSVLISYFLYKLGFELTSLKTDLPVLTFTVSGTVFLISHSRIK